MSDLLTVEDLLETNDNKQSDEESLEGKFDLLIPPGVPQDIIMELIEEFDLEPLDRKVNVSIAETDPRDLLALRGNEDAVNAAHDLMLDLLQELIEE